jgi:glucan phosphoethanolaminetransferase (alkaline phosphatase superfamily)
MVHKRQVEKNRAKYMIGCFIALLAIVYIASNMLDAWHKYEESKKRLEASINSLANLSEQYEDLKKQKSLEESSTGYEMHVRSKFDMNKPDENVIFIVDEDTPVPTQQEKGIKKMMNKFKNFFN